MSNGIFVAPMAADTLFCCIFAAERILTMYKVAVIILNWNGASLLRRYLPAVVATTPSEVAQVIVADNGSSDESLAVLREGFPTVCVMAFDRNLGFAEGYNRALAQVTAPYVVLLNSDVATAEGWIAPLLAYAEAHPEVAALQPKLLSDRDRSRFEYAGAAGGYLDKWGYPYCRGRIFDTVECDRGQYDTVAPLQWATGACLWVRREAYLRAGGLDARFFAHMEEIDLCWRLRRMGYGVACVPQSVAYHLGGASLAMGDPRKTYLNFRNSLLMLWKNLPAARRRSVLRCRGWLDALAAVRFLVGLQWSHAAAVCRAHRDAARMIRAHYAPEAAAALNADGGANRKPRPAAAVTPPPAATTSVADSFPQGDISILAAYYLRRKRRYSDLFG